MNIEESRGGSYIDDMSGNKLNGKLVEEARSEELREFERMGVWKMVSIDECRQATGKGPRPDAAVCGADVFGSLAYLVGDR